MMIDDGQLTGKATLNARAAVLEFGVRAVVGLIVTPFVVSSLGRSLFGVWQMLLRLSTYLAAADGRPAEALRLVVANRLGPGRHDEVRRAVGSALYAWLLFLPLTIVAGAGVVWLAPTITHVEPELAFLVRLAAALLVINFILTTGLAIPEAVLHGANLGYTRIYWVAGVHVVGGALTVGAVSLGWGVGGLAGAQIVTSCVGLVVFLSIVRKFVPQFGVERPRATEFGGFVRLSTWSVAGDMIASLALASDVLILGALATSSAVTSYVLTGYAANALVGMISLVLIGAAPGLGALIGDGQSERAVAARNELIVLTWIAGTVIGATVLMWNRSFVTLWVGPEHYAGQLANLLLAVLMFQTIFIRVDAFVINATLDVRGRVLVGAVAAVLSVGLAALLTPSFQIVGLCTGVIAGRFLQTVWHPRLVRRLLGEGARTSRASFARQTALTAIVFSAFMQIGERLDPETWLAWATGAAACVVVTLALAWGVGLDHDSRELLKRRVVTMFQYAIGPLPVSRTL